MLDRSPGIAIPSESVFVPLLARRHGKTVNRGRFLDDLSRLPKFREWGLTPDDVAPGIRTGMPTGEAIAAIFEAYAQAAGKPRWGDKTPLYMQHLDLIAGLFPDALYVHLIRDGRDAALSFAQMPEGTFTRTWAHPGSPVEFACRWRQEVRAARALGRRVGEDRYLEVRYERLVREPDEELRGICDFAGLPYEREMLEYAGAVDVSEKPHHRGLLDPPRADVRRWREQMDESDAEGFDSVAGDLLRELGYPATASSSRRAAVTRGWYAARLAAWNAAASVVQRSPLWRRRHPVL
jgi:hypothetical protein